MTVASFLIHLSKYSTPTEQDLCMTPAMKSSNFRKIVLLWHEILGLSMDVLCSTRLRRRCNGAKRGKRKIREIRLTPCAELQLPVHLKLLSFASASTVGPQTTKTVERLTRVTKLSCHGSQSLFHRIRTRECPQESPGPQVN